MALSIPVCAQNQQGNASIEGNSQMRIDELASFNVENDEAVQSYRWIAPVGCRIESGQGTASVEIRSTFLSQDSPLRVIRTFADNSADTLKHDVSFIRYVKDFKDYILRNDLIKKHGGNMRVLLDKNISDKIKKEKVLNLITTDVRFATWASETLLAVAQNDPVTYYKLKSINEHVKEKYSE